MENQTVVLAMNAQEAQVLLQLIDAGVRHIGLDAAAAAGEFHKRITEAVRAAQAQPAKSAETPLAPEVQ